MNITCIARRINGADNYRLPLTFSSSILSSAAHFRIASIHVSSFGRAVAS